MTIFENRLTTLKSKLQENGIDTAIITDEDNVYYLCGYYDYLHMEFGRPTLLIISIDHGTLLITPTIDLNTAEETACVDQISAWNDGMGVLVRWQISFHSCLSVSLEIPTCWAE